MHRPPVTTPQPMRQSALPAPPYAAGDHIALYLPLTAEAVAAYLGLLLAGCTVVCIADSYPAAEVAARLRVAPCRAIVTQVWVSGLRGWKGLGWC